MTIIALIVAAGSGSRTGLDFPKQYLSMGKDTVLCKSANAFLQHPDVDYVQVIINPNDVDLYKQSTSQLDVLPWIAGGETRQMSVAAGLDAIAHLQPTKVLIHDAARPLVSSDIIDRCLEALDYHDAVLPALPAIDTLKTVEGDIVSGTLNRNEIVAAQTPQCFDFEKILAAHRAMKDIDVTDDIALAERVGIPIRWVLGSAENKKITTKEDIRMIRSNTLTDIRNGLGFDVHCFAPNREMWLGGIKIPFEKGLKGHSDADVALHALTDAVLGAIGAGDIGTHFPPSDDKWKGVSSDRFLAHAAKLVEGHGGLISNVDLTIICEAPKIGPHREAMKARIAEILNIDPTRVSVKGTTTEKLGFTGRGEGIAAQAIATVRLPE
ncbi:bifunctional 2-C-methyl-D-erythritol 4-phosphate cytidylyltransferase/2-C-methyl-D-erythritol 2,4-cyclodiphosphate synthase [Alphaproteobacteria bacterium 46_93_T64]|nr:bifunctional 2-C-methyl-D-erythritol 4-phosphate cytidylyltransferase/2-C-methyl-D-erythritol 2,4-cyclodiphosphate synthase [Alphaproteobacteria bacterium 46_93_T64]